MIRSGAWRMATLGASRAEDGWLVPLLAGGAAVAIICLLARPWLGPTNDPDSMNSVLYFQRIMSGHRLEITVLTTPKPLLTLLYGATWRITGSWSWLVWETVAVHAMGVALATRLAMRLAGIPAGLFLAVALVLYSPELTEVLHANSLPYAVAAWSAAGLAATARPPRWWLVGGALLLGALARTETLLIVGIAALAIVAVAIPAVRSRLPGMIPVTRTAPILIAWLAVPISALHDTLLTGNPLYTPSVPTAYTELVTPGLSSIGPLSFAHSLVPRYAGTPILVALALVGFGYLLATRRWASVLGLGALSFGGLALLGYLAWRGTYVSARYYEEPTIGFLFLSALAVGGALTAIRGRPRRLAPGPAAAVWVAGTLCVAIAAPAIAGVTTGNLGAVADRARALQAASRHLVAVEPRFREILADGAPAPPPIRYGSGFLRADPAGATLFVPGPLLGRIAVDTDTPLTRFGDLSLAFRSDPPANVLRAGQAVYHDPLLDNPASTFRIFQISRPAALDGKTMTPLAVSPGAYWLVAIGT